MGKRQTNLELLRIICILLIVSMHICGKIFDTDNLLNKGFILGISTIGNTGVTLFLLISGYFGIYFNIRKLFKLLIVTWFYSLASYVIYTECFHMQYNWLDKISFMFPIFGHMYWFITAYVIIFCFSPFLNRLILALSRKEFELLLCVGGFFFILAPTFLLVEIQNDFGKGVINLTLLYLIGQYFKYYGFPQCFVQHCGKLICTSFCLIFLLNALLTATTGNITLRFARDNNLLILIASIAIFYQFVQWRFSSSVVNGLASYVFSIYLCHNVFVTWMSPLYLSYLNSNYFFFLYVGSLFAIFFCSAFVEWVRRILFDRLEIKMFEKVEKMLCSCLWYKKINQIINNMV